MKKYIFCFLLAIFYLQVLAQVPAVPTMDEFLGVNILTDRADFRKAARFRTVRVFQDWPNDAGASADTFASCPLQPSTFTASSKKLSWSYSYNKNRALDFVQVYRQFNAAPVLNQLAPEFWGINAPSDFGPLAWYRPVCKNIGSNGQPQTVSDPFYALPAVTGVGEKLLSLPNMRFAAPLDYRNYTKWATLFAAQFGSKYFPNGHPLRTNFIDKHVNNFREAPKVGIQYIEIWNEADKFWKDQHILFNVGIDLLPGTNDQQLVGSHETAQIDGLSRTFACFRPDEYGAMLSAAYDGHFNSAGFELLPPTEIGYKHLGIKNIDPSIKVVFTGLVDMRHNYLEKMLKALYFGAGARPSNSPVPFDVLNFHHYSSTGGGLNVNFASEFKNGYNFFGAGSTNQALFPESTEELLKTRSGDLIEALTKTSLKDSTKFDIATKEIWISEFGYDSYLESSSSHGVTGMELPSDIRSGNTSLITVQNASFENGMMHWGTNMDSSGTTTNPHNVNPNWPSFTLPGNLNMAYLKVGPTVQIRRAWNPSPGSYVVQPYTRYKITVKVRNLLAGKLPALHWVSTNTGTIISNTQRIDTVWTILSGHWFSGAATQAQFSLVLEADTFSRAFVIDDIRITGYDDVVETQGQWLMRSILEFSAGNFKNRHLDKVFIYKLNDDPGQANNQFGYCGLLDAYNTPKKSWYFIRTLQNALHGLAFESDVASSIISNFTPTTGPPINPADLHVYRFGSITDPTLAVWFGTASGMKKVGQLNFANQVFTNKTLGTLITVNPPDESGTKTKVLIEGTTTRFINNLEISETPIFLKIGVDESDPPVAHVKNLQAAAFCCNGVKLQWEIPQNQTYTYYRIYYAPSQADASPPFDVSTWTLYAEQLPGSRTEIVVSGLEKNVTYAFAVVPVVVKTQPRFSDEVLPDLSALHLLRFKIQDCAANCLLQGGFSIKTDPIVLPTVTKMLDAATGCDFLKISGDSLCKPASTWAGFAGIPASNTFTLDFENPQKINAIYYYTTGLGRLVFEYEDCFGCFHPLTTLEFYQTTTQAWGLLDGSDLPPVPMKKLRVTRTGLIGTSGVPDGGSGFGLCKMLLCAEPAECEVAEREGPEQIQGLHVEQVSRTSAIVSWQTALLERSRPEWGIVPDYEVSYSTELDEQGLLTDPETERVSVSPFDALGWHRLSGLEPGTTYHVEVKPLLAAIENPCEAEVPDAAARALTAFETEKNPGASERASAKTKRESFNEILLYPNPAADLLRVVWEKSYFTDAEVIDNLGRVHIRKKIFQQGGPLVLPVSNLAAGIYYLKMSGDSEKPILRTFVKL